MTALLLPISPANAPVVVGLAVIAFWVGVAFVAYLAGDWTPGGGQG